MSTIFYIVRHGQSEGNVAGDVMGGDPALTEKGIEQAQFLANLLFAVRIDQIFSSDLIRARQTAEIIAASKDLEVLVDSRLRERSFGELESKNAAYFSDNFKQEIENFRKTTLANQMTWKATKSMESLNQIIERILPFFAQVSNSWQNNTILLVSHANVMMALLAYFHFIDSFSQLPYGSIQNTAYMKVEKDNNLFKIVETFGISKKE